MAADSRAENRMNLAALQQSDPYITGIVQTASQVALYTFSAEGNEWEKTDIEGSLFVYARSAIPYNGFMIMNRLSMKNLTEPVTKELEFQLQDPFLLYKTAQSIYGLWFYDKTECQQIARLMESLVYKAKKRAKVSAHRSRSVSESDAGPTSTGQVTQQVDIMQMLSRAQKEYNKTQQGETSSDPSKKSESPPFIASGSPTVVRPVPVKAEDGAAEQNMKNTAEQPTTNTAMGQRSQGPSTHPGFNRSVSMQSSLGYLSGNAALSSQSSQAKVTGILQKLLSNPGEGSGVTQQSLDYPLSKGQIQTVESLERRQGQKLAVDKVSADHGPGQGSGQGSNNAMRTVESIEKEHANVTVADGTDRGQGYPIQNLLAQLNIAQQAKPTGQHEATEGGSIITQPASQGGIAQLPPSNQQWPPAIGQQPPGLRTTTEEVKVQLNSDISQKLLTNRTAGSVAPTNQPSTSTAPLHLIQPSSIRPNLLTKPQTSGVPADFPSHKGVPSLQQLASRGGLTGQRNIVVSTQATTNGITTQLPTSPQKIPGSVLPPTLLTPQAFRKRSSSETVTMANPSQLFPSLQESVVVQPGASTSQQKGGPPMGLHVNSTQHSPFLNRLDSVGRVSTAEALNKEQFKQAFVHLIQNDSNFLSSLHNAYLQSLQQPPM